MFTLKQLPKFPKYFLRSDGLILFDTGHGLKARIVEKDKGGFRYVVLFDGDIEKKVFLLALKFPRGEGYENVMRLKERERRKLKKLKRKGRRLGRHHRSLKELRKSLQKFMPTVSIVE